MVANTSKEQLAALESAHPGLIPTILASLDALAKVCTTDNPFSSLAYLIQPSSLKAASTNPVPVCAVSPRKLQRNELYFEKRLSDGLAQPVAIDQMVPYASDSSSQTDLSDALFSLSDQRGLFPRSAVDAALADFANTSDDFASSCTDRDRLALFLFATPFRLPGTGRVRYLSRAGANGTDLLSVVHLALSEVSSIQLSDAAVSRLVAANILINQFLWEENSHGGEKFWEENGLTELADRQGRRAICRHVASGAADDATVFQLYREVNRALRDHDEVALRIFQPFISSLQQALQHIPESPTVLYRVLTSPVEPHRYSAGSVVVWPGISSATDSPELVRSILERGDPEATLFIVHARRARWVGANDFFLPPNSCFRVHKAAWPGVHGALRLRGEVRTIELFELPDDQAWAEYTVATAALKRAGRDAPEWKLHFRSVMEQQPSSSMGLYSAAVLAAYGARDPHRARQLLFEALALDPANVHVLSSLGYVCEELRDFDAAELFLRLALHVSPYDISSLINLIHLFYRAKRWEKGRQVLELFSESALRQHTLQSNRVVQLHWALLANPLNESCFQILQQLEPPSKGLDCWEFAKQCCWTASAGFPELAGLAERVWDYSSKRCRF
eukprot:TRINITY_DN20126_c0_g1_i1.p1 TRINITY_DN20126_c0_g1~~TRINITY_DN20126_c0_g1_i1.p1  ORF type:complete len:667 (-),score=76.43 TRINITY_DN20126_c0_g1_i1:51-1910(-)